MRIQVFAIIIFFVIGILTDVLIYKQLKSKSKIRWLKYLHVGIAVIAYALMIAGPFSIGDLKGSYALQFAMWSIFLSLSVFVPKFLYALFFLISRIPALWHQKPCKPVATGGIAVGALLFCLFWWSTLVTTRQLKINEVEIESEKIPSAFNGYRIVQFSDLHSGTYGTNTRIVANLVEEINSLDPDLIVFTGDIVSIRTDELLPFIEELKQLKARDGVISILGNHDYGDYTHWDSEAAKKANFEQLLSLQRDSLGWTLLTNQHEYLHSGTDSLLVVGVENWGEPPFNTYGDLKAAMPKSDNYDGFTLLLSHNPKHWEMEVNKKENIDLTLSGHTHAMQAMLTIGDKKYSPSALRYDHWQGLTNDNGQLLYVNIGIGEVGIPTRIGATPEITVFTLVTKNDRQQ